MKNPLKKKQSALSPSLFSASLPLRRALNLAILAALYPAFAYANPDGAQVVSGQVSIDTAMPGVTTVTNSPNAIINWQNFSIGQNELTQFIQQNGQSAVLNRIIGQNPSEILGQLTSNGKVFLINPNGIVFGAGAVIDTQGLIASSLALSDQDFQNGNYHFIAGSKAGNIRNEGIIRAGNNGSIILIAPQIENNGIIRSDGGSITLAAGHELTITNLDNPDIRFQVQAPADSVLNLGKLLSEGGAINVFASTITHSGEINADSVQVDKQGHIQLVAGQDITLTAGSKISANNSLGDAGTIHIDSKTGTTLAYGTIEARSAGLTAGQATQTGSSTQLTTGKGGKIELLGERVGVLDQAKIDASGQNGGGQVLIGGDYQGKNPAVHNAKAAYVGKDAIIKADAKATGNGGKVIVWSNESTRAYGDISAKGGSLSGNGGFIETSGHWLDTAGIRINASAPHGQGGEWLLDPYDIIIGPIVGYTGPPFVTTPGPFSSIWTANQLGSVVLNTDINTQLNNGTNVTIYTGGATGSNAGNIGVEANISKTGGGSATLNLKADNRISILNGVSISSTSNTLNVILNADADGSGSGYIFLGSGASIISNGGNITLGGGANPLTTPAIADAAYDKGVFIGNAILNAGAGSINIRGSGRAGISSAFGIGISASSLITTSGSISLDGTGGAGLDVNYGVSLDNSTITTSGGNLSITGKGQGTGSPNTGIAINSSTLSTGSGNMSLNGTGGNGTNNNHGVSLYNSALTTTSGALSITGAGQGTGTGNMGILINSSTFNTGTGNLTLNGAGGNGTDNNYGIGFFESINTGNLLRTNGGALTITGTGRGTGIGNSGINVFTKINKTQLFSGSGTMSLNGYGVGTAFGMENHGLRPGGLLQTGAINIFSNNSLRFGQWDTLTNTGLIQLNSDLTIIAANGDIHLNGPATAGLNKNLTFAAIGGNFINNFVATPGQNTLNVSGTGRWLIYSKDPAGNTLRDLAPAFELYGCLYSTGCTGVSIPTTGNGLLYSGLLTSTSTSTSTSGSSSTGTGSSVLSETVTTSTQTTTSGVLGTTTQLGNPLTDNSSSNNSSTGGTTNPTAEDKKTNKQCTK